jgi:small subunit ribosomal protein S25e
MGGGKKNKSLSQMTKEKAPRQPKKEKAGAPAPSKKKNLDIVMPDVNNKNVVKELKGLKVLTPSVVAARYNVRLSVASTFLKELEKRKLVEFVSGGKNLKIYKPVPQK